MRILATIVKLYRSERPLAFFSGIGIALAVISVGLAIPIFLTFLEEGIVAAHSRPRCCPRVSCCWPFFRSCGLVLDTVTRGRREMKLLAYLRNGRRRTRSGTPSASLLKNEHVLRELVRTNDAVLSRPSQALLDARDIPHSCSTRT